MRRTEPGANRSEVNGGGGAERQEHRGEGWGWKEDTTRRSEWKGSSPEPGWPRAGLDNSKLVGAAAVASASAVATAWGGRRPARKGCASRNAVESGRSVRPGAACSR